MHLKMNTKGGFLHSHPPRMQLLTGSHDSSGWGLGDGLEAANGHGMTERGCNDLGGHCLLELLLELLGLGHASVCCSGLAMRVGSL